jgi:uncharacterized protein
VAPAFRIRTAYAGIGIAAGFFSALFGVGGGIVVVPLLVALAGYAAKTAMATSLGAILFTAVAAAASHAQAGNVDWSDAALLGLPAIAGALAGAEVHRRVETRRLVLGFAAIVAAAAVRLAL